MALHAGTGNQNIATGKYIAQGSGQQYNADTMHISKYLSYSFQEDSVANDPTDHGSSPPLRVLLPFAHDAPFNSQHNQHEPACLPNTRVGILRDIISWADGQDSKRIFWLNGVAGAGKSTIARTIARCYNDKSRLGASFFFSRGNADVSHAGSFFTSIAVQLAEQSEVLECAIRKASSRCPDIGRIAFRDQWNRLILRPLSELHDASLQLPLLLVIDALDECDGDDNVTAILECLEQLNTQDSIRLRVFITSRPETVIRIRFRNTPGILYHRLVLHDTPRYIVDQDIAIFFKAKFGEIRNSFNYLAPDWPGDTTIDRLVQRAEGLFIYASTVCGFVKGEQEWPPEDLLKVILDSTGTETRRESAGDIYFGSPSSELDNMYIQVLKHSFKMVHRNKDKVAEHFRWVVGSIVIVYEPLSAVALQGLLALPSGTVHTRLKCLHSVLNIPDDQELPIRLSHPSFRDFLLNKQRCNDPTFWVDEKQRHKALLERCLQHMSQNLHEDICELLAPSSLVLDIETSRLKERISPDLRYACLYWSQHLQNSGAQVHDYDEIHQFLKIHLLHWLETLAWVGKISEAILAIISLEGQIQVIIIRHPLK